MLYSRFLSVVEHQPNAVAMCCGDQTLSYSELNHRILAVASRLHKDGFRQGQVVALLVPNGIDFVVATFAAFRLGGAVLPLNIKYTDKEIESYLEAAGVDWTIQCDDQRERASNLAPTLSMLDIDSLDYLEPLSDSLPALSQLDADAVAMVLFSSGTTGLSKQVCRSYRNLYTEWENARSSMLASEDDVILCSVPMFHAHGFANCIMASLLNGAELVVVPGEFNPRAVVKKLIERNVSIYPSSPFMIKMLCAMRLKQKPDPQRLRWVFTAGAMLDQEVSQAFAEVFEVKPFQLYGTTETGAMASNVSGKADISSVGQAFANTRFVIVDEDSPSISEDDYLPAGEVGEVCVATGAAASCYENNPEQSGTTFVEGYYRTGDLGYLDSQDNLFIVGRKKSMINVAGLKVDPAEVEKVILSLDGVQEVVVLGKPDSDYGEMVKAVVVANKDVTEADIQQVCKEQLVQYKQPKSIEFRDSLPRSPLGKILRKYL